MLDNKGGFLAVHDESLDDSGGDDTLLGVQVGRWLIDEVDVCGEAKSKDDGHALQLTTRQILDFLVDKVFDLQRLVDVGLELWRKEGCSDTLEEELTNGACELGSDLLRLHADVHLRHTLGAIWFLGSG